MDKVVAETVAYFRDNAADLRRLGKEMGLTESEIQECVDQAMSAKAEDLPTPKTTAARSTRLKFAVRRSWPRLRKVMWVVGSLLMLVGVGNVALQFEVVDNKVSKLMEPYVYPFMKTVRDFASPLHDKFDLYDYFMSGGCFVDNPLFDPESLLGEHICDNCYQVTNPLQFTAESLKKGALPGAAMIEPVLFKAQGPLVTFENFQNNLSSNKFSKQKMLGISSTVNWAEQPIHLIGENAARKLAAQPDFHFHWLSKQASVSQVLRKIFPRPSFIHAKSDVGIPKRIFLNGPQAPTFKLAVSTSNNPYNWYAQGSGSVKVTMFPPTVCGGECSPFTVTLQPQDILVYNTEIFRCEVTPLEGEIIISFLGSFTPIEYQE